MKISVITPHLNSGPWLRLCIASVADQQGVEVEHIIQDGGSRPDGLVALEPRPGLRLEVAADSGMYDAINRGWRAASGEVLAHLNADEQYLPGALAAVAQQFEADPQLDVLLADTLVVDPRGGFLCCRKSLRPLRVTRFVDNPTITSSIFIRRRALQRFNLYFDTRWRIVGDTEWMRRCVMQDGLRMRVLRRYTSVFTESGDNLDLSAQAAEESRKLRALTPRWSRLLVRPLKLGARLRRLWLGGYHQRPFAYEIFTLAQPAQRQQFHVSHPTCVWWTRAPRTAGGGYRRLKRALGDAVRRPSNR